ncbi:hypothetical protein FO440_01975 [Mucilaginibacter corticis]|uniref:DUF4595 domain-containing protein n=1 Tax=Mucilaginibacter corticis TaxID=2597670 RepID=A0A556MST6_9SPHI|nr:hypothetical protein [Mucilaginibacter corticis]TSJ42984.1 hypothetical protein FO440_01975 [Mucilaginibacter corticis]
MKYLTTPAINAKLIKLILQKNLKHCLAIFFAAIALTSCKKDHNESPSTAILTVNNVSYQWGELAINKKYVSDSIKYNSAWKIDSIISYDENGQITNRIGFTYSGSEISLNSPVKDKYTLDSEGRVIMHTIEEIQHGTDFIQTQRYSYDPNGYLSKVTMSLNVVGNPETTFSVINYEVKNGNYTKYALSNTADGAITRQYDFSYNTAVKINSPVSLFAPIFSNNTISNIDKYLNYGKNSVNLLSSVNYTMINLDKTTSTGTLTAETSVNSDKYLTQLTLNGATITSFPSDNISPLPRSIKFSFKK